MPCTTMPTTTYLTAPQSVYGGAPLISLAAAQEDASVKYGALKVFDCAARKRAKALKAQAKAGCKGPATPFMTIMWSARAMPLVPLSEAQTDFAIRYRGVFDD